MTKGPTLRCIAPGPFDGADVGAVRRAFRGAPACALGQAWLPAPQKELKPGAVRAGVRGRALLVLAELEDEDIHSRATGPNQRFWELGDTFEIFLEAQGAAAYLELHVAPNGHALQLRIPIPRPRVAPEKLMVEEPLFERRAWLEPGRWTVFAEVPFASIGGRPSRFSFSRYDYTRGKGEPVLSSTSPHAALDFHRRDEWGSLAFS